MPEISELVHQIRRKFGLSQVQLAQRLGVAQRSISGWENGTSSPNMCTRKKLLEMAGLENISKNPSNEQSEETHTTNIKATPPDPLSSSRIAEEVLKAQLDVYKSILDKLLDKAVVVIGGDLKGALSRLETDVQDLVSSGRGERH